MEKNQLREETHENMRKATSLSKQTILLIHQKKFHEAEKTVATAKDIILNLQNQAKNYPEIIYGGMFSATLQEYSEANIFWTLISEGRFITPEEIRVSSENTARRLWTS